MNYSLLFFFLFLQEQKSEGRTHGYVLTTTDDLFYSVFWARTLNNAPLAADSNSRWEPAAVG